MELRLVLQDPGGRRSVVHVSADDASSVGDLVKALGESAGIAEPEGLWVDGSRLDDSAVLFDTAIRYGSKVALRQADATDTTGAILASGMGWQLHVVGGPDSGTIIDLPIGRHELGRQGAHGLVDKAMSRRHAAFVVSPQSVTVSDLGSANGLSIDGKKVPLEGDAEAVVVPFGAVIAMGDNLLCLREAPQADAPVVPRPGGTLELTRPPRLRPPTGKIRIRIPDEPEKRKARKIPLIGLAAPLVLGVVMAFVEKAPTYLLFSVASPIMAVGNLISDRKTNTKDYREQVDSYKQRFDGATEQLENALVTETQTRREAYPDASAVAAIAIGPGRRLWERRRRDPDFLDLRVGVADLPSQLEVEAPNADDSAARSTAVSNRTLYSVPATFSLLDAGVAGIAGPRDSVDGLTRWLVMQMASHHAPRDLSLTLLTSKSASHWDWFRWIPHAMPAETDSMVASVGNDPDTVAARLGELASLVRARKAATGNTRPDRASFPAVVAIVDDARSMRALAGLAQVLKDGPDVGVFAICSAEEDRFLPEECTAVIAIDPIEPAFLTLRASGHAAIPGVLADTVTAGYATGVARALSAIRDATADEGDVSLPESARLLDILGMEPPSSDAVRARWVLEGRTTKMAVGIGSSGPFELDLRRDGPHGLVAGTTGAGKSEFLQTVIASLAASNRPENLNFVLVDYKGGSAFKDCVRLPHTVGMVTDLDAHLVERAIISLSAELKYREHVLAGVGAKDIEDYCDLYDKGEAAAPLGRLVIVIDEFASMARELPDFVTGLVNIAQRGRSLGIHLVLATQRPSGVVSPEIRSNTNLRIALRVTDVGDSADVIDSPEAAKISKTTPGRGYARLGHSALEAFQAGRIGGRRPGSRPDKLPPPYVAEVAWGQLGYSPPTSPRAADTDQSVETDLAVLVDAVRSAAELEKVSPQRSPWLPALPERLLLGDVVRPNTPSEESGLLASIVYGLTDLPGQQRQAPALFALSGGHLTVIGSARSGRSQILRTIAASAASEISTKDLHLYGIDCGNGALGALTSLPHCGAVAAASQPERTSRLLGRLSKEVERRQLVLGAGGFADITEQRRAAQPSERLAHIILFLDRWEGFVARLGELDGGRLVDAVAGLLRDGTAVGVHVIATGDRTLGSGKIGSLCDNKLAMRLADKGDYTYVGINPRQMPDSLGPGRAFATDTMAEIQVALLDADDSGTAQARALQAVGGAARRRDADTPTTQSPFRVDELPTRISYSDAKGYRKDVDGNLLVLAGVGGDELAALGPDLGANPTFVVAGPAKSGRSAALAVMTRSLVDGGAEVLIAAPRNSPLRTLGALDGVRGVITNQAAGIDEWQALLGVKDRPVVVVIDDGELLRDCPAGEMLREVMRQPGGMASGLILGGNSEGLCAGIGGWQVEAKKARQGMLLSPQALNDGELIGIRLSRGTLVSAPTPGRGLLHLGDGELVPVAVPLLD